MSYEAGNITRVIHGVYGGGPEVPAALDIQRATALVTGGVCDAVLTAQLQDWDGVERWGPHVLVAAPASGKRVWTRRVKELPAETVEVEQVRCLTAPTALRELASVLDDIHWEQALEFCLRKRLVTASEVGEWRHPRVRRMVTLRGGLLGPPDPHRHQNAVALRPSHLGPSAQFSSRDAARYCRAGRTDYSLLTTQWGVV